MAKTVYVVINLSSEDEVGVCEDSFTVKEDAMAHVLSQRPNDGEDEWGGDEPMLYWLDDNVYNEEGRILYMVRKVTILR